MKLNKWTLLSVISVAWLILDQWTKYLAVAHLTVEGSFAHHALSLGEFFSMKNLHASGAYVVTGWWEHYFAKNPGAAWSFLANAPDSVRAPFFHLVSIAAIIFIIVYYRKLKPEQRYTQIALALVFGGALGNALDRVLRGYVIDFIVWHAGNNYWPTFNIADSGISVGLALLFLEMLIQKKSANKTAPGNVRT